MSKRLFDIIFSIFGLMLLWPVFLVLAIAIKIDSPGPVFYRQERIGRMGIPFRIYKFRTMVDGADRNGLKVTAGKDPRITGIGGRLREYKLDELPQLINVLTGQMSFVGPRPEVEEYVKYYTDEDKQIIHSVSPGITDPASIKFRSESDLLENTSNPEEEYINNILPKKIQLYRSYIKQRTFWLDIQLILKTIAMVVR